MILTLFTAFYSVFYCEIRKEGEEFITCYFCHDADCFLQEILMLLYWMLFALTFLKLIRSVNSNIDLVISIRLHLHELQSDPLLRFIQVAIFGDSRLNSFIVRGYRKLIR
jgi:hypothetical protein